MQVDKRFLPEDINGKLCIDRSAAEILSPKIVPTSDGNSEESVECERVNGIQTSKGGKKSVK